MSTTTKPNKPHRDFPLYAHASGRWAKKVRGKLHYFGSWADPQAALDKWLDQKDALLAGRVPRPKTAGATVRDLVNAYLTELRRRVETREVSQGYWGDMHTICDRVVTAFGAGRVVDDLVKEDFDKLKQSFAATHKLVRLRDDLNRTRIVFNWGIANGRIPHRNYRALIKLPSDNAISREQASQPSKEFTAAELRALIDAAPHPMKAMLLLGINCGYGNSDCALLTEDRLDVKAGWATFPRPKTGKERRAKLWPETVKAVMEATIMRPQPKDKSLGGRVFITAKGNSFEKRTKVPTEGGLLEDGKRFAGHEDSPISKQFKKLLITAGLQRTGRGFYSLRRMFETIGGASLDQAAVDYAMGHTPGKKDMSARYRLYITDERLEALAKHVRAWLFPPRPRKSVKATEATKARIAALQAEIDQLVFGTN